MLREPEHFCAGGPASVSTLLEGAGAFAGGLPLDLECGWMAERLERDFEIASIGPSWCRIDPWAHPFFREASRTLAEDFAARRGIEVRDGDPDAEDRSAEPGLSLDRRFLGDRLAEHLIENPGPLAFLAVLLPALGPFRGKGSEEALSLALLESAARAAGLEEPPFLELPGARPLGKRAPRMQGGGRKLSWSWSRGGGFSWEILEGRPCKGVADLEVQGDAGYPGPFEPGLPQRPRIFEARHMSPVVFAQGENSGLILERELKLPADPGDPGGRRRPVPWRLGLCCEAGGRSVKVEVSLKEPVPGQRYRLRFPFPFWPRPAGWLGPGGEVETVEGPRGTTGTLGLVELHAKEGGCRVQGPGLREFELLEVGNDIVLALTLARIGPGSPPPAEIRRWFRIDFPD